MILSGVTPPRLGRGTGLAMLLTAGFVLPLVPGWSSAQSAPTPEKPDIHLVFAAGDEDARKIKEAIERKARELDELITEMLRSPHKLWLRLWPRG